MMIEGRGIFPMVITIGEGAILVALGFSKKILKYFTNPEI